MWKSQKETLEKQKKFSIYKLIFNQTKIMGKRYLYVVFLLFLLGIIWVFLYAQYAEDSGIQKWLESVYVKYYLNDFNIVESKEFGNYLRFDTKEDLKKINDYLDHFEERESVRKDKSEKTSLDNWEENIKEFTSLRSKQKPLPLQDRYSSPAFATLLNENGYIEVDNILYHDKWDDVYIINRDIKNLNSVNEKLFFSQKSDKTKKATCKNKAWNDGYNCDWDDITWDTKKAKLCHWSPTFQAWVKLDHWKHYITWNERLYMRAYSWVLDCNHNESLVQRKYTFSYDYEMKLKDYDWSWGEDWWNWTKERTATNGISIKLISADDICLKKFDLNVTVETLQAWGNVSQGEYLLPKAKYTN